MAKTYPTIDDKVYVAMDEKHNSVSKRVNVLVRSIRRITSSGTSPNWPSELKENSFSTDTVEFNSSPVLYDPFNGNPQNPGYRFVSAIGAPSFVGPSNSLVSQVEYIAQLRMYSDIPQITANLALLYKERKKTGESILTALSGILKCVRDVRKGRVPELFMNASQLRGRKKFTGAWLNYVYGIKPFAQDLYSIAHSDVFQIAWLKGKCTEPYQRYLSTGKGSGITNSGTYQATFKGGLSLSSPIIATLAGSGMTNPGLIVWELTPFSFMADWLLPVGPFLEMLSSTSGYNKHSGSVTRGIKEIYMESNSVGASAHGLWRRITRNTISFPSPPLPRFKNPFSPVHALNTLSIIHQFVKSPKQRK